MDDTEHRATDPEDGTTTDPQDGITTDEQHADRVATPEEGPANPSDEPEDRSKSPEGGADYDDDEVAVDPEDAPSANAFMIRITAAMFVVVILLVLTAITGSPVILVVAFISIMFGVAVVLHAIFNMMSTD
jgi:hypothetical protein